MSELCKYQMPNLSHICFLRLWVLPWTCNNNLHLSSVQQHYKQMWNIKKCLLTVPFKSQKPTKKNYCKSHQLNSREPWQQSLNCTHVIQYNWSFLKMPANGLTSGTRTNKNADHNTGETNYGLIMYKQERQRQGSADANSNIVWCKPSFARPSVNNKMALKLSLPTSEFFSWSIAVKRPPDRFVPPKASISLIVERILPLTALVTERTGESTLTFTQKSSQ